MIRDRLLIEDLRYSTFKILQSFGRRLRCNTECQKYEEGSEKRQQCERENCEELAQIRTAEEIEEEYDYR